MVGIYKITNKINGKVYIGQSIDINKRWSEHKLNSQSEDTVVYRAMRKYGLDNFLFEVLEECHVNELDEREIYYIDLYKSYIHAENSNGYNMTLGGGGSRGLKLSKEARRKLSIARTGTTYSEEVKRKLSEAKRGAKNSFYGKSHTEASIRKISEAKKGGKHPKAKKVICLGVLFDCGKDCAEFYGVNYNSMRLWLNGNRKMPKEWVDKGLCYVENNLFKAS